jgi:hypothetical protein
MGLDQVNADTIQRIEQRAEEDGTYIVFTSHRARDNGLGRIEGVKPRAYFSFHRNCGQGIYKVTDEQLAALTGMKGWRKLRGPFHDLMRCWS